MDESPYRVPSRPVPTQEELAEEAEKQCRAAGLFDLANWCREVALESRGGVHRASTQKVKVYDVNQRDGSRTPAKRVKVVKRG